MSSSTIEVQSASAEAAQQAPAVTLVETPARSLPAPVPAPAGRPKYTPRREVALGTAAVLGMGYVGLPTSLALAGAGWDVTGIDVSRRRLEAIQNGAADMLPRDRVRLERLTARRGLRLTDDAAALSAADTIFICVPTPVDADLNPDLTYLRAACETVVAHARPGQLILLTSTSYVGTTTELLTEPLWNRGLIAGDDVFVAFSPERIDPGNTTHRQEDVPRVVGGATEDCTERAADVVARISGRAHRVSSPEAAELCKLYENSFRAVNIGFANEIADATRRLGLDPVEVAEAAATKPYGFMAFQPGPGVGGHCIPCDPHYLLQNLRRASGDAPILARAMQSIAARPHRVVERAQELLAGAGVEIAGARVLVVGASYKPGVMDTRESPAVDVIRALRAAGADVALHDPLVRTLEIADGVPLMSLPLPRPDGHDLVIVMTVHPGHDYSWLRDCPDVLDCTYRTPGGIRRSVI
jgi:UDP-N-acetyl-D-glucosamine dehydrogenase